MMKNFRRFLVPLIIIGVLVVIAGIVLIGGQFFGKGKVTISSIETMQMDPPTDYDLQLTEIIQNHPDPYIRERALFTLTDIAIRKNESGKVVSKLREIALNEQNADLQSAAYANLALIETVVPTIPQSSMDVSVQGTIGPGQTIKVIANITSQRLPTRAIVGISHMPQGLDLQSSPIKNVKVVPGNFVSVPFTIMIRTSGRYKIPISLLVSYNRVESEKVNKNLYLTVNTTGGNSYIINRI